MAKPSSSLVTIGDAFEFDGFLLFRPKRRSMFRIDNESVGQSFITK